MSEILKNIFRFASGSTLGGVFNFITFFIVAKMVGPANWGVWMIFNIILKFSPLVQFGAVESVHRQAPMLLANGNNSKTELIQNNALGFSLLSGLILTFLVAGLSPFLFQFEFIFCLLFAPIILLNLISYNYGIVFRSHNQFDKVGWLALFSGLFSFLSILLAFKFNFFGFLIGQLVRFLLTLSASIIINNVRITPSFNWDVIKSLIRDGFPISLIVLTNYLITLSDRLILAQFFETKFLGFYGLAYLIINPFVLFSSAVNSVFYTNLSSQYSKNGGIMSIDKTFLFTKNIIAFFSITIGIVYILLPLLTEYFLTEYKEGIESAKLLLIGNVFFFSSGIITNIYFTLNKQQKRLRLIIISLVLNVSLSLMLLLFSKQIESVAIGSLASFVLLFVMLILGLNSFREFDSEVKSKKMIEVIVFQVGFILLLIVSDRLSLLLNEIANLSLNSILYLSAAISWSFLFIKKQDLKIWNK